MSCLQFVHADSCAARGFYGEPIDVAGSVMIGTGTTVVASRERNACSTCDHLRRTRTGTAGTAQMASANRTCLQQLATRVVTALRLGAEGAHAAREAGMRVSRREAWSSAPIRSRV